MGPDQGAHPDRFAEVGVEGQRPPAFLQRGVGLPGGVQARGELRPQGRIRREAAEATVQIGRPPVEIAQPAGDARRAIAGPERTGARPQGVLIMLQGQVRPERFRLDTEQVFFQPAGGRRRPLGRGGLRPAEPGPQCVTPGLEDRRRGQGRGPLQAGQGTLRVVFRGVAGPERLGIPPGLLHQPGFQLLAVLRRQGADVITPAPVLGAQDVVAAELAPGGVDRVAFGLVLPPAPEAERPRLVVRPGLVPLRDGLGEHHPPGGAADGQGRHRADGQGEAGGGHKGAMSTRPAAGGRSPGRGAGERRGAVGSPAVEVLGQHAGARVPIGRVGGEAARQDRPERGGDAGHRHAPPGAGRGQGGGQGLRREILPLRDGGGGPPQAFAQDQAHREDVGPVPVVRPRARRGPRAGDGLQPLGGHVRERAAEVAGGAALGPVDGQVEVEEQRQAVGRHQDVGRLQVAVRDAPPVGMVERLG